MQQSPSSGVLQELTIPKPVEEHATTFYGIQNLEAHNHDTRSANNVHQPITNLTEYQNGVYYTPIKIFNYLPNLI
jgi:hypothetical protein